MRSLAETILARAEGATRFVVAIAGAPGAGKSTLSHELVGQLPAGSAVAVPMDGFHYDNRVLDQLNLRHQKGAPQTFDFGGLKALLSRIRHREPSLAIPLFDREIDLARAGAAIISETTKFILVEGNYLLLDEAPWRTLKEFFDLTIFLDVARDELERRLMQRWLDLGDSHEKAAHWVASNDMPNVDRVLGNRLKADITLSAGAS